ncbi:MAG: SpoIIE family protein phosphatase [Bacteroidales bacterium]|nr:SpoIIE family protein phosphatase [Bacteroidales bacterium]
MMYRRFNNLIFILALIFACSSGISQEYRIREYGVREGISHPFVYTVNQDAKGFIWAGTGEGLCRFDGFEFATDIIQDSIAGAVVAISFKDSGGTLWFGYQSGDIISYDGEDVRIIKTGDEIISLITGFAELNDGKMIFATQSNGIFLLNSSSGEISAVAGIEQYLYTSLLLSDDLLLLGKQEGLAIYELSGQGNEAVFNLAVPELQYTKVQDIQKVDGEDAYWIATEDQGLFKLSVDGRDYEISTVGAGLNLGHENIQSVYEDPDGTLWLSSLRNGVYRLRISGAPGQSDEIYHFSTDNGLTSNLVKEVFQDLEGNIWIATYGGGLNLLIPQAFSIYTFKETALDNDIQSVFVTDDDTYYLGGREGLYRVEGGPDQKTVKINGLPADRVTALRENNDNLLIGTENSGLFALHLPTSVLRAIPYSTNSPGRSVNSIAADAAHIYLGTKDGIYILDHDYSGVLHFTTAEGLPHNNIQHVFIDRQGKLLFATQASGIYQYLFVEESGSVNLYPATSAELDFMSIVQDENGGIWAATYGDGILYFDGDSIYRFSEETGLKSNFCYSLVYTGNQNIWVGHRLGISRINIKTYKVSVYDVNIGITGDCNQNAVFTDRSGRTLFGTTEGLLVYDPDREITDRQPPFTNITGLLISDRVYDFNREIILPYSIYKLRIDFIGLDYSDPQSVTYQYKLEGYDLDWSDISNLNYATYPRIEDGTYTFYVRSYSNEGLTEKIPASFTIRVKLPFWKTFWFIALSVLVVFLSIYFYIKIRERKQKQLQEYLERELEARTKEVVEQKEVIEIKNRDITDSINYAKRIQTSLLPPVKKMQQYFSGCFVFYSPRDIVSGDFYWFDRINEHKFVIVCADSTGHGVPGAFMSMIGSTLIKDICTRKACQSPSQALKALDSELSKMLNQNLDDGTKPSDGMDIIVCEIDLKTYYVRYASAMRPMIIYRNGEEVFIKGSRSSVGGHYDREDNEFMDEGIQLSKGDIIYMFSDGYSDQFGGPMGKKFKMVRLKNLLQDIHDKSMEEQYNHVSSSFNQWKENYDQIDDVLFMGIKI